jgi:polar amino acid transport system substrate-binding protein
VSAALRVFSAAIAFFLWQGNAAPARSLEMIRADGAIHLCAHPNSLPYANKAGDPPGFQIEFGRALATELRVALATEWIVIPSQIFRANCDIVLDAIADPEVQADTRLQISKPYYRSGVALAVPRGSTIVSLTALDDHTRVGVQVGSVAAMVLSKRGVPTSTFGFEEDMLGALAAGEIEAAAVTPLSAGYYNLNHRAAAFTILPPNEAEPDLVWNVGVGMRNPDRELREAIDTALDRLRAAAVIEAVYARYGISLLPPR